MTGPRTTAGRMTSVLAGAALTRAGYLAARRRPGPAHPNYRGRVVNLAGGPALGFAATLTAATGAARDGRWRLALAAALAGGVAGLVGRYDDLAGGGAGQRVKGLAGHLGALRRGRITTGAVKLVGLGLASAAATALISDRPRPGERLVRGTDLLAGALVIAGTANLTNLLDLRPGRALKAGLALGAGLLSGPSAAVVGGPLGAALALLPDDLGERTMLGDCGANSLGALLGLGMVTRTSPAGRSMVAALLVAATMASERISFSAVIEADPLLRRIDRLGRRA